ncbi:Coenzyme F420 hydrogenase/dehydrogenase, beta subunit C-terminal domain [Butyrivibrio sp. XPD2002]|uniref:Coenzyme F420 hydrogenase/dehydrogenase, beta subunit C-terminal domain n=1 Tax=Butyrivibrio sp. XPD2002 TaxID=1280665 RepID=UPI00042087B1|nr:Coenzyme F420 hydrogenase/dehydrogenase, beta subunit C-terminal domain [Butyrivibrio sp. XPD2002]
MRLNRSAKKECCGCRACEQICPKKAIVMQKDKEGFAYPIINEALCVNCGLCLKACSFNEHNLRHNSDDQKYYWVINKNSEDRKRSRSGGFFFVLAQWMIKQGGIVYGSILDENNYVRHIRALDIETCKKMQGSKYVESDISGIYSLVKKDLENRKKVLFCGTACQVSGLYGFMNKSDISNLYTIDIVCHGVCSSALLNDYLLFWEKKKGGKITEFNFRDKTIDGWDSHVESFVIKNKKYYRNNYTKIFYSNNALRPSCYNCKFAKMERVGDFTLADFWGVKKYYPELNDNKGISSIFLNTTKAKTLFDKITDYIYFGEVSKESIIQKNLYEPSKMGEMRDDFWEMYSKKGFSSILKKYGGYDILRRLNWALKRLI